MARRWLPRIALALVCAVLGYAAVSPEFATTLRYSMFRYGERVVAAAFPDLLAP